MTEQDIIELGFDKVFCGEFDEDWYYYRYSFVENCQLLSSTSNEVKNNNWFVDFSYTEQDIRFTNASDVKQLIELIS